MFGDDVGLIDLSSRRSWSAPSWGRPRNLVLRFCEGLLAMYHVGFDGCEAFLSGLGWSDTRFVQRDCWELVG